MQKLMTNDKYALSDAIMNKETCRTCANRERWECGGSIFQYCSKIKSKRTQNGLKKIKCKNPACGLYQPIK